MIERALTREKLFSFCRRYKHFPWAALVPAFIAFFLIIAKYRNPEIYYSSYIPLDDKIPFVPQFILAYYAWFPLLAFTGLYHLFTDSAAYKRYIWALMIGFFAIQIFYIIFPNGQDLRIPFEELPDNVFGRMVEGLWRFDNNRNVIPSMHVYALIIIVISVFDSKYMRRPAIYIPVCVLGFLIASATVLIKQHSIIDLAASLIPAGIVYALVYILIKRKQKPNTLLIAPAGTGIASRGDK